MSPPGRRAGTGARQRSRKRRVQAGRWVYGMRESLCKAVIVGLMPSRKGAPAPRDQDDQHHTGTQHATLYLCRGRGES